MKYGLIGEKLSHSFSPMIHKHFGNEDYILREISPEMLPDFFQKRDFLAINVTIPYKQTVIPYCDKISQEAKKIGSVNTILNQNGILYGYNTDYYGFAYTARLAGISFTGKKVLILGSGGTCNTVKAVAADSGASKIIVVSREGENNYQNLDRHFDADVIINTTPVGMFPNMDATPVSLKPFSKLSGVIDAIYNPLRTNLLIEAKWLGIPHSNGLSMLVAQAKQAHELFFNTTLPDTIISEIQREIEKQVENIILIGMPGVGKTCIGTEIANLTGRQFIDTDKLIEEAEGKMIPEIFAAHGEAYFRQLETEALQKAISSKGRVIATGGGIILSKENRRLLMRNGFVVWLTRELSSLDTAGRPLSKSPEELAKLLAIREPLYNMTADITMDASGSISEKAQKILTKI